MKRKDALYELLIQHAGTYCSGETLAQELGISRAAVWKAVQTLRTESNVPIQSHPKRVTVFQRMPICSPLLPCSHT